MSQLILVVMDRFCTLKSSMPFFNEDSNTFMAASESIVAELKIDKNTYNNAI